MEQKVTRGANDVNSIDGRKVTGFAAVMGNIDDGRDRIFSGAFRKTIKENGGRVKHFWQHDIMQPPTAMIVDLKEVKKDELPEKLVAEYPDLTGGLKVVREYLDTPRGNEILGAIKVGALTEMSIGYDPIRFDFEELKATDTEPGGMVRNLREIRLWDTSDVNFGMNPATVSATKKAVPYKDTGKADEGTAWSAPSLSDFTADGWNDLSAGEISRISAHYAFSANWPAENFGDLKLPHHLAGTSGVGKAVWRGVAAAMAALLGARGGVSMPDADKRSVYNHLSKHYAEFDKEPPDLKLLELSIVIAPLLLPDALKEGRVLSKRNLEKLTAALQTLNDILLAAEPSDDEKILTATEDIFSKIAKAELDLKLFNL